MTVVLMVIQFCITWAKLSIETVYSEFLHRGIAEPGCTGLESPGEAALDVLTRHREVVPAVTGSKREFAYSGLLKEPLGCIGRNRLRQAAGPTSAATPPMNQEKEWDV